MKITRFTLALVIVLALLVGTLALTTSTARADPNPSTVGYWQSYTLLNAAGVTTTQTTAVLYSMVDYGVADCYVNYIAASSYQTLTVALQDSPDNTGWRTSYTFAAISSASVAFTRTAVYGYYHRAVATLGDSTPITYTVKCVAKDN